MNLKASNISFSYTKKRQILKDVSLSLNSNEIIGLMGDSGSGKSTLCKILSGHISHYSGEVTLDGNKIQDKGFYPVQLIYQHPEKTMNPKWKMEKVLNESWNPPQDLKKSFGLKDSWLTRWPSELSGGELQRFSILRALNPNTKFIIADEPISALDVSIQAQVVNLMQKLQRERGLTYLFIAHDLSMVKYISDRIGVMHWGKMLEIGTSDDVYNNPIHPYTKSLLSAIPEPDPESERGRVHQVYDPTAELDGQEREMREITPGHFVLSTEAEAEEYKKALQ